VGECSFWYRPTRVVPDQRPLNGRCCCCCCADSFTLVALVVLCSGVCRRVAVAAMSLLCESGPSQQFSLHAVNDAFLAISTSHPTLMVQWCNILILLNYGEQSWWSQLLQTPHMQMSSISTWVLCRFHC